ncbi:MAG: nucleotidyltransferase domain-containing protein [Bdellovibrionales bacterium]|nr:nucleotidyltransferase domain-containing protein [Bdellovibrionales bacterium]
MIFGLSPEQQRYIFTKVVRPLRGLGLKVFCYGSRARGTQKPFSDLDLMIEGSPSLENRRTAASIQEELTEGNFPLKVDLVFLDDFAVSYRPGYEKDKREWPEL